MILKIKNMQIDDVDLQILHHLQNDARISNIDLADKVGLTPSPCLRRVKALEDGGVIRKYVGLVDPAKLGLPISIFINVSLQRQERGQLEEFETTICGFPEVMECYLMTGSSDYLVRIVVPEVQAFERFLADHLTRIPGVANIQSSFAVKQVVYNTQLPLIDGS